MGELVTADGGVPVWHRNYDGGQADVGTVVETMEALRKQVQLPECLVIGDSKLLCREVIARLQSQGLHFLAPLPRSAELDEQFLTLDPAGWERLDYLPQRQERLAPEEQTQYLGQEAAWEWSHPKTGDVEVFRRLFVISSEERATCRKVRTQQMARAEAELAKVASVNFICSPEEARRRIKRVEQLEFEEILIGSQFDAIEEIERVRDFLGT